MPIMVGLTLCSCDAVMYRVALAVRRGAGYCTIAMQWRDPGVSASGTEVFL